MLTTFTSPLERLLVEGNGSAARYHRDGSAASVWSMFRGEGCARRVAAEDDIAGGEAYGDGTHRPGRPLRGVHGRIPLSDRVCQQRFEVDATVLDEAEV